jgi:non-specific serine/threonine protein kinase
MESHACDLALSPEGRLYPDIQPAEVTAWDPSLAETIGTSLTAGLGPGLLALAFLPGDTKLPPAASFWRRFGERFLQEVRLIEGIEEKRTRLDIPFAHDLVEEFIADAPPMRGGEYLRPGLLFEFWLSLREALCRDLSQFKGTVKEFFFQRNPSWRLVERVYFNLAENKNNPQYPFAFLATYTSGMGRGGVPCHLPLKESLEEYAGARNRAKLLELLKPLAEAGEKSPFLQDLVETKQVYYPLGWKPNDAFRFLRDVPIFEAAGIMCRIPDWWKARAKSRMMVQAKIGNKTDGFLNFDRLMDFSVDLVLGDQTLTPEEWEAIKAKNESLVFIRGQWVELDTKKLEEVLAHWKKVQRELGRDGIGFIEAMRMLAGAPRLPGEDFEEEITNWSRVVAGDKLRETLECLRRPEAIQTLLPGDEVKGTLRPYQEVGVRWLGFLDRLGLGSCLADDMGLGKTLQILAFLAVRKKNRPADAPPALPNLLIVPASLMGNWETEIRRFTPGLKHLIAHSSAIKPAPKPGNKPDSKPGKTDKPGSSAKAAAASPKSGALTTASFADVDLVITSYGYAARQEMFAKQQWDLIILDEAQAIKNPNTRQTRTVKKLSCRNRLVLTGTPVENRLSDLWSIFDFLNPGLLGSESQFGEFVKQLSETGSGGYGPLRQLVRPYILRRLKTDKNVIADLPDKTEVKSYCHLSKTQTVLYQDSVEQLGRDLAKSETGIQRKGLILAFLLRLKQICNHPSQWLRDGRFAPEDSGKFGRLTEICEEIASRGEKVLMFTQFREMTAPLEAFSRGIFGKSGLVLHGGTPVKERQKLVEQFQSDPNVPYFILSLKAGGTGLNLTAASHVIHFDRWWNPAVENQATDRAFRIGQKKNVMVHKFVCRGTVEEKIDALIEEKTSISNEILADSAEALLTTEMSDSQLLSFVALDLSRAGLESS